MPQNDSDIEKSWEKIREIANGAAENLQVLGSKKNNKCFNTERHEVVEKHNLLRINVLQNTIQENILTYQKARDQTNKILRQNKRLAEKKLKEDIEIFKRLFFGNANH